MKSLTVRERVFLENLVSAQYEKTKTPYKSMSVTMGEKRKIEITLHFNGRGKQSFTFVGSWRGWNFDIDKMYHVNRAVIALIEEIGFIIKEIIRKSEAKAI